MNINIPNKIDSEKSVLGAMFLDQHMILFMMKKIKLYLKLLNLCIMKKYQ